jgi:hypothetical protein
VEVHHVHPPPSTEIPGKESEDATVVPIPNKDTTPSPKPLKVGGEDQQEVKHDSVPLAPQRPDPTEAQAAVDEERATQMAMADEPRDTVAGSVMLSNSTRRGVRISNISVKAKSPPPASPKEFQPQSMLKV